MKRLKRASWPVVALIGFLIGYAAGPGRSAAQQEPLPGPSADQTGALNRVDGVHQPPEFKSTIPAPLLPHGARTMWPNQPNESTFWSIDDIRKAHQTLAAAAKAGRQSDPNGALHDFPYWTRTHAMFVNHVQPRDRRQDAEQHLGYAQFVVVMGGAGAVTAGGRLQNARALREANREIYGELRGSGIMEGETFRLKEGDWVSIPPNVPAQFSADTPDGLTYMVMKINAQLYPWDLIR